MLVLLVLACADPDPNATGPRWDTAVDYRPTVTGTDELTVIDTGTDVTGDTAGDPSLCLGEGRAAVQVGFGGLGAFTPYVDDDELVISLGPAGDHGFRLDLLTEGLDTSADMNVILRLGLRGNDAFPPIQEEYLAKVVMQCPHPGPGWVQVFAPLPDDLQGSVGDGSLSGMRIDFALSMIDRNREEDTVLLDLSIQ